MQAAECNLGPGGQTRLHDPEVCGDPGLQALTERTRRPKAETEGARRLQRSTTSPDGTEEAQLLLAV